MLAGPVPEGDLISELVALGLAVLLVTTMLVAVVVVVIRRKLGR